MSWAPGTMVGKYRIERVARETDTRTIYDATIASADRKVSIHTLADPDAHDFVGTSTMFTEAMACAAVESVHALRALDFAQQDDVQYLVTVALDGFWLSDAIAERGALPEGEAVRWLDEALAGLVALHRAGYVHRDVKPDNMHVSKEGGVILTGFGTALKADAPSILGGEFVGTPAYMAPEQVENPAVDARADVWAWGVSLYEALSGRLPFSGPDLPALFATMRGEAHRPLETVSAHVARIVDRCLAKDPSARFPTAAAVREALLLS